MARRNKEEKPEWEIGNIGLMMVTSLNVLLLAFFIMLSSKGIIEEKRYQAALGSLTGAFRFTGGAMSPIDGKGQALIRPDSQIEPVQRDLGLIREALTRQILQDKVHLLSGRTRKVISLESTILFPPGGVEILSEMKPLLREINQILKGGDYPVVIEGHTDDQPPRSEEFKDNWQISALRATAVLRFFLEEGTIAPNRLSAFGYGGNRPMVVNNSPRNRARNNRLDLVLDEDLRRKLAREEERRQRQRIFDFKGFSFNLFGW
ncbi:MAG: OmpA family protein [Thermodesulfobacteriota bacterium]